MFVHLIILPLYYDFCFFWLRFETRLGHLISLSKLLLGAEIAVYVVSRSIIKQSILVNV